MKYSVQVTSTGGSHTVVVAAGDPMAAIIDVLVSLEFDTLDQVVGISVVRNV
jgi:hypothetical protein